MVFALALLLGGGCFILSSIPMQAKSSLSPFFSQKSSLSPFSPPHAVEGADNNEEHAGGGGSGELIGKTINFLILFGGLAFLLRKRFAQFLSARTTGVKSDLDEAESSRTSSRRKLKSIQSRLAKVAKEAEAIKKEAEKQGKADHRRILSEARAEAQRLRDTATQDIETLGQFGIQELRAYTAELATQLARDRIKESIKKKDQSALIDRSIEKLETLYEKPGFA